MEGGVDSSFLGHRCCPLGIFHENHGAHRRDGSAKDALKDPLSSLVVSSPIVSVDDEKPGVAGLAAATCRILGAAGSARGLAEAGEGGVAACGRSAGCIGGQQFTHRCLETSERPGRPKQHLVS